MAVQTKSKKDFTVKNINGKKENLKRPSIITVINLSTIQMHGNQCDHSFTKENMVVVNDVEGSYSEDKHMSIMLSQLKRILC